MASLYVRHLKKLTLGSTVRGWYGQSMGKAQYGKVRGSPYGVGTGPVRAKYGQARGRTLPLLSFTMLSHAPYGHVHGVLMYMLFLLSNICVDIYLRMLTWYAHNYKAGPPVVTLFIFWHFLNKVAPFHSYLCVWFDMWHKRFRVNERTYIDRLIGLLASLPLALCQI